MDLFAPEGTEPLTTPLPGALVPLAERMRPKSIEEVIGQEHLTGPDGPLFQMARSGRPQSVILWGPPGTGKTTLAQILADLFDLRFVQLSAIETGVADLRSTFEAARQALRAGGRPTLLFVDEIHRLNRGSQQDAFLPHIENGTIILVGATTQSPSFSLSAALTSRAMVLTLNQLGDNELEKVLARAEAKNTPLPISTEARGALIASAGGDARYLLGQAEILMGMSPSAPLSVDQMSAAIAQRVARHDRAGDGHYSLASAFQKAMRGSDPSAALYYAARMVDAGEDLAFVWRRLLVTASEDVGMADPQVLQTVVAARQAFEMLGMPEGGYALSQAIIAVATAPKSNSACKAWGTAMTLAQQSRGIEPPKHILNAPTALYERLGFKQGYVYDHDQPGAFSGQNFWPDNLGPQQIYTPSPRGFEARLQERLVHWDTIRETKKSDPANPLASRR